MYKKLYFIIPVSFYIMNFDLSKAPNTRRFIKDLEEYIKFLDSEKIRIMRNKNMFNEIEDILSIKFPELMIKNYALVSAILKGDIKDFSVLNKMINLMVLIETKQINQDIANECMKETLNEIFIYSKFGGKEAFEKVMRERNKK